MTRSPAWMLIAAALLASCAQEPAVPSAPLQDTFWRTIEIEGVPYSPRPGVREPHLLFAPERVTGFTGCNNLTGGYEQDAARLRFKAMAMTRMACLPDNGLEARFVSAIDATTSQRINGSVLELLDDTGRTRMRLEARGQR